MPPYLLLLLLLLLLLPETVPVAVHVSKGFVFPQSTVQLIVLRRRLLSPQKQHFCHTTKKYTLLRPTKSRYLVAYFNVFWSTRQRPDVTSAVTHIAQACRQVFIKLPRVDVRGPTGNGGVRSLDCHRYAGGWLYAKPVDAPSTAFLQVMCANRAVKSEITSARYLLPAFP